jgi:hypothetical protein
VATIETGLITLLDECPIFQFTTSHLEEFDRPFYSPWTCSTSIYLLKGDNQSPSCLAVPMELDPSGQVVLDAQCATPGCLRVPYRPFIKN